MSAHPTTRQIACLPASCNIALDVKLDVGIRPGRWLGKDRNGKAKHNAQHAVIPGSAREMLSLQLVARPRRALSVGRSGTERG